MAEPKKRGRPQAFDRHLAVAGAMEIYWRDGPDAFSLNEICRRVGLSKPGLYREFGGEDGLMDAVLTTYFELALRPLLTSLTEDRSFGEMLEGLLQTVTSDHGTPPGCLFVKMRSSPRELGPATTSKLAEIRAHMRDGYVAWVERGVSRGEISSDISPDVAARHLDAQVTTMMIQMASAEAIDLIRAQARLAFACFAAPHRC